MEASTATNVLDDFSLEMTGKDVPGLQQAAHAIPQGTRVNITFLGNENLEMRLEAAKEVLELGFVPVPHISARRLKSETELREFLDALQQAGASDHVFVVGGDPATPEGPYPDSLSVIRTGILQEYGVAEVGIAGYPEGHPDISTQTLWEHMSAKSASLTEQGLGQVVLTQFAFDAEAVVAWVHEVRGHGIEADHPHRHARARRHQATPGLCSPLRSGHQCGNREEVRVLTDEPPRHSRTGQIPHRSVLI